MTISTTNLGLTTYNVAADGSSLFLSYRTDVAGSPVTSNLQIIDNWAGETSASIVDLQSKNRVVHVPAVRVSGNYFLASPVSEIVAYVEDMFIDLVVDTAISGSATLQINSLGIKDLKKVDQVGSATALQTGDLRPQKEYFFRYDGTQFVLVNAPLADQINVVGTGGNFLSINPSGSTIIDSGVPVVVGGSGNHNLVEVDAYGQVTSACTVIYKNILLNGGFDKYSRNPSPATGLTVENNTYCFDRWILLTQTAAGSCLQISGNTNHLNAFRFLQPQAASQRMLIEQIIEYKDSVLFREQYVTFSGFIKSSANRTITAGILSASSTADVVDSAVVSSWTSGTPSVFIGAYNVFADITFVSGSSQFTPFYVSGYVPVTTDNLIVAIWSETVCTVGSTIDIVGCGLYPGKANPSMQPLSLQEDPFLNRYVRTIGNSVGDLYTGMVTDSGSSTFIIPFDVEMRTSPSAIVTNNLSQFNVITTSGTGAVSAVSLNNATKKSIRLDVVSGSQGESAGEVCFLNCAGGSGLIYFETEL